MPSVPAHIIRSTIASVLKLLNMLLNKAPKFVLESRRLPWALCFVFSFLYFAFFIINGDPSCKYQPSGFCVTGYDPSVQKCPSKVDNSHTWAAFVDVMFTLLVLYIGHNPQRFPEQQGLRTAWVLALTIISHGLLHGMLGYYQQCKDSNTDPTNQNRLYAVFILILALVAFRMTSSANMAQSIVLSILATFAIFRASILSDSVSPIFAGTQLIVSIIAVWFPKNPEIFGTQKQGWYFVAPCIISLWELLGCCDDSGDQGLFNKIGGHVWYDITLHYQLIVTQLTPKPSEKKDK